MKFIETTGTLIPALGLGTFRLTGQQCINTVSQALDIGYRHLDSAQFYENEKEIGSAVRSAGIDRSELFITTKIWPDQYGQGHFLPAVESSLQRFRMDYVDLLFLHWPPLSGQSLDRCVENLMEAQSRQLCRYIGISNFNIVQMKRCLELGADIVVNQVEYHVYLNQDKLLEWMRPNGIALCAYCPLAKARLKDDPVMKKIASKYAKTEPQIALRWLMQQSPVMAIPKSSRTDRLRENFEIFDFELTQSEMGEIGSLTQRNIRLVDDSIYAPEWD